MLKLLPATRTMPAQNVARGGGIVTIMSHSASGVIITMEEEEDIKSFISTSQAIKVIKLDTFITRNQYTKTNEKKDQSVGKFGRSHEDPIVLNKLELIFL